MNFTENIKEAIKAIKDNLLRTSLTVSIIAIGITSLVGILTAIDSIQYTISEGLSDFGSRSFSIANKFSGRRSRAGIREKTSPSLRYREVVNFKDQFEENAQISIETTLSQTAEAKYQSKKTNPNTPVLGIDENYLLCQALNVAKGRSFSTTEIRQGIQVAIIGEEIAKQLFVKENPINKNILISGKRYNVVGVLEEKKGIGGGANNRYVLVPLVHAVAASAGQELNYSVTVMVSDVSKIDNLMEEARGLMRRIRKDNLGGADSFELSRSESIAESINETSNSLKIGGLFIGFLTLLGASIGLMNIMMVSVTERTREIGVRKALGATKRRIREQFLIEAVVICQFGGLIGIALGLLVGNAVASLLGAESLAVPWAWIIAALVVCVLVGVISGFYPAYRASQLDPIESLRYD